MLNFFGHPIEHQKLAHECFAATGGRTVDKVPAILAKRVKPVAALLEHSMLVFALKNLTH